MKVGLFVFDVPQTLGGGYVFREEIANAAFAASGRHQFEPVRIPFVPKKTSRVARVIERWTKRICTTSSNPELNAEVIDPRVTLLESEIRHKELDLLWFNHYPPIDVGTPYILNIFDLQHRLQPWFPEVSANGIWDARERELSVGIRRAAIVTVGSQEAKEQLSLFYGVALDNIYVLPFPTPQSALDASRQVSDGVNESEIRNKYGVQSDFIFYPAQFWPHKNHVNLLRALRVLREQHGISLSLVLTGADHGNLSHVRKVASELDLDSVVHFLGFVPYEDVIAFYRFALALSYVSFFGPENLPPLEALALGCPVVLADIPGVRTLFGEAPVTVDPRNPHAIAAGIRSFYDNPDLRRQRELAGRTLAAQNSVERYIEGLLAVLDKFEPMRRCWQ